MNLLLVLALASGAFMVKRQDFKTCQESGFCVRQQAYADLVDLNETQNATYSIVPGSITFDPDHGKISAKLMGIDPTDVYNAEFHFLVGNTIRFKLTERDSLYPRYDKIQEFASISTEHIKFSVKSESKNEISVVFGTDNQNSLVVISNPFKFELAVDGVPAISWNERGYLFLIHVGYFYHENYRKKEDSGKEPIFAARAPAPEGTVLDPYAEKIDQLKQKIVSNYWSENFGGKTDNKPKGPSSIGLDVTFPGSEHVYGLPEHASSFSLKTTRGKDAQYDNPYRLYNLDVFEYELDNPMALYGSIPFMMSHKKGISSAILWLNAAEMWVDIEKTKGTGDNFKLLNYVPFRTKKETSSTSVETHWMVESGIVDLFLFLGPTQDDIFDSYTRVTGRPQLPQSFSIAYHQCRWNYITEQDVSEVDAGFDEHDIPYDVLWLDIEHTNGKRYFTWDKIKFSKPEKMQNELSAKSRKMVTIIDPHIFSDENYDVWKEANSLGLFVKNEDGNSMFSGHCWPGESMWLDYTNPEARAYWANRFAYDKYIGSTPSLYTWNDMNEPSVFSGPEITMPKGLKHYGDVEHRDIHNMYGMLQHRSTYEGHLYRSGNKDRPFILSRAFFVGTQRYGAIWTGDNDASWEHLAASVPMLLTIGTSGVTFAGADVGGFFRNPDPELMSRWYQLGSLQPFFRAHAHIDTRRREPWLFGEPWTGLNREAVRRRYRLLPYIYTLFLESHIRGKPIMRAMVHEFPNDEKTFAMDDQFMLGSALAIKPVTSKGQKEVDIYLGKESIWYDYDSFEKVSTKEGRLTVETPLEKVAMFIRGGKVIPRRDRVRRSSHLMSKDPYTLIVALDLNGEASGNIYVDDGSTFEYQNGSYIYSTISFKDNVLSAKNFVIEQLSSSISDNGEFNARIERIIIMGVAKQPQKIQLGTAEVQFKGQKVGSSNSFVVVVKNPPVIIGEEWNLLFQ